MDKGWIISDVHFTDYNNSKVIWNRLGENHNSLDVYNPQTN